MNFKNSFLTIIIAIALVSCSSAPTQSANVTVTSEVTVTYAPTATITPTPTEEIPTALKPGNAETLSPEQQAYMDSEWGKAQQDWLTQWVAYWTTAEKSQRVFSSETPGGEVANVHLKVMTDPKSPKSMTVVLESSDYPEMIILPPAWAVKESPPLPTADPNHEVSVENQPLFLDATSGEELAKLGIPNGSNLAFTNDEFMMVDPSGKIVGLVDYEGVFVPKGQWVSAETIRNKFPLIIDKKNAGSCNISTLEGLRMFRLFGKIVDSSEFPEGVVIERITMDKSQGIWTTGWAGFEQGTQKVIDFFTANPDLRPFRVVAYCRLKGEEVGLAGGGELDLKVMKFIDASGRISFLNIGRRVNEDEDPNGPYFPAIMARNDSWKYVLNSTEIEIAMLKWVETQIVPRELERYQMFQF